MSIHNWDLWHAARRKRVDTQATRLLEKTSIVKSGKISAAELLQQLQKAGLEVAPLIATEYDWEANYREVQKIGRRRAIVVWTGILTLLVTGIVLLLLNLFL